MIGEDESESIGEDSGCLVVEFSLEILAALPDELAAALAFLTAAANSPQPPIVMVAVAPIAKLEAMPPDGVDLAFGEETLSVTDVDRCGTLGQHSRTSSLILILWRIDVAVVVATPPSTFMACQDQMCESSICTNL